jgi:hypothetical protein
MLLSLVPSMALAQPSPAADPGRVDILTRFAFHLGAERLAESDPRFTWDANYGGEVDLVDFGRGRATFYANYQVILGDELKAFDPNQGNYILGGRVSGRLGLTEAALVFHHESRHLSDRAKVQSVDWNMLGARIGRRFLVGSLAVATIGGFRGVVQKSLVDYRWEIEALANGDYPVSPRMSIIAAGGLRRLGVDGRQNRDGQTGGRAEAGIRLNGRGAAVELFVSAERRIDPHPLEFGVQNWVGAGFRLVNVR